MHVLEVLEYVHEVKARKWLIDVAIVCPATKSVVARQYTQYTHVHPGVSAR